MPRDDTLCNPDRGNSIFSRFDRHEATLTRVGSNVESVMDSTAIRGAAARSGSASVLPTMTTSGSTRTDEDAARLVVTSAINFIDAAAVNEFIRTVETEGLETIRQRALYSDWVDGRRHRPYQDTSSDDAKFFSPSQVNYSKKCRILWTIGNESSTACRSSKRKWVSRVNRDDRSSRFSIAERTSGRHKWGIASPMRASCHFLIFLAYTRGCPRAATSLVGRLH